LLLGLYELFWRASSVRMVGRRFFRVFFLLKKKREKGNGGLGDESGRMGVLPAVIAWPRAEGRNGGEKQKKLRSRKRGKKGKKKIWSSPWGRGLFFIA